MTLIYLPPLDRLLTYGDCRQIRDNPDYVSELGLTQAHIPDLIRMSTDEGLLWAASDSVEVWAPVHAWRSLGQLRAEEAIDPLISLLPNREDDEWITEELPDTFGMIGAAAIPALTAYMANQSNEMYSRITAVTALEKIGTQHSDARDVCITAIAQELEKFAQNDPEFNGFLVCSLIELKAVEAAPVIERAYNAQRVAYIGGDWEEVQVNLGLKTRDEVPHRYDIGQDLMKIIPSETGHSPAKGFASAKQGSKPTSKSSKSKKNKKRK